MRYLEMIRRIMVTTLSPPLFISLVAVCCGVHTAVFTPPQLVHTVVGAPPCFKLRKKQRCGEGIPLLTSGLELVKSMYTASALRFYAIGASYA